MSDGADRHLQAMSWIGAERAELEEQRARIEAKHAALIEVEVALVRYTAICGGSPVEGGQCGDADSGQASAAVLDTGRAPASPPEQPDADCGALEEPTCAHCGTAFEPRTSGQVQRFCTPRCRRAAWQERRRARDDAGWRGRTAQLRRQHAMEGTVERRCGWHSVTRRRRRSGSSSRRAWRRATEQKLAAAVVREQDAKASAAGVDPAVLATCRRIAAMRDGKRGLPRVLAAPLPGRPRGRARRTRRSPRQEEKAAVP